MNTLSHFIIALGAMALLASPSHAQLELQTVALTDDAAPGPGGHLFNNVAVFSFPPPGTADGAFSIFPATTIFAQGGASSGSGIFGGLTGQLQILFRVDGAAPGTNGAVFGGGSGMFESVVVNDLGFAAMRGFLTGGDTVAGSNNSGIWVGKPGELQLFARAGQPVPSPQGNEIFASFDPPGIGNAGQVIFRATTSIKSRIYAGTAPGNLHLVVSRDDPVPITIPDRNDPLTFGFPIRPDGNRTRINLSGQPAFRGDISGFSVASGVHGIFVSGSSGIQVVAHTAQNRFALNPPLSPGSEAPGTGERGRFTNIGTFEINEAGQVAFHSEFLSNENIGSGLWIGVVGSRQLIARTGTSAGVGGATFDQFFVTAAGGFLNDDGEVVFQAQLLNPALQGVFRGAAGQTTPIAYQGQPAGDGWTFQSAGNATINNAGQVAFTASLQNMTESNINSLWLSDAENHLSMVTRVGATFEVRPGDTRTVTSIVASRIDDDGQVVFRLEFAPVNGGDSTSGIFIAGLPNATGTDFYWNILSAVNDNWHTTSPSTNWTDSTGVTTTVPGTAGTEKVFIEDASVRIADAPVEIGKLTATGTLTVRNRLFLGEDSSFGALILDSPESKITAFGNLTLNGESRWETGPIELSGNTLVNGESLTLNRDDVDYELFGTVENKEGADFVVRGRSLTVLGQIVNHGTWSLFNGAPLLPPPDSGTLVFENRGRVELIAPGATFNREFNFEFNTTENDAVFLLDGVSVSLNQPGTQRGQFILTAATDHLTFRQKQTMVGGSFTGRGVIDLRSELLLPVSNVTTELGLNIFTSRFQLSEGARLAGDAELINLGNLDWGGGEMAGTIRHKGLRMQIGSSTGTRILAGGRIINEKTIEHSGSVAVRDGGKLINEPGSSYHLSGKLEQLSGERGFIELDNAELTVLGEIALQLRLNNGSRTHAQALLTLHGGGNSTGGGSFLLDQGALEFRVDSTPSPYDFTGSYSVTGRNGVTVHPGASINVRDGELTIQVGTPVEILGDLRGREGGKVLIDSDVTWEGGLLENVDLLGLHLSTVTSGNPKQIRGTVFVEHYVSHVSDDAIEIVGELRASGWTVKGRGGFTGAGRIVNEGFFYVETTEPVHFSGLTFDNRFSFTVEENGQVEFAPGVLVQLEETGGTSRLAARFFDVKNGGRLTLGNSRLASSKASIHLHGTGTITNLVGDFTNEGNFNLSQQAQFFLPGIFTNDGTVEIEFGSALIAHAFINTGLAKINGELTGDVSLGWSWQGSGKVNGNVLNSGSGSPGNSPGTFTIVGDYTQQATANLRIELGSPTSFDLLSISGQATLDGTLTVALLGGYLPSPSDRFTVIDATQPISGTFWNVFNGRVMAAYGAGTFSVTFMNGNTRVELGDFKPGDVIDSDGDGLSDEFEQRYFGNPGAGDPDADPDGDGATNREEYAAGTNPVDPASAPSAGDLLNISTRMRVGTGENVLIGGMIVTGNAPKKVIIRAIGPSLASAGLTGVLLDPTLELFDGSGNSIASNDNWKDGDRGEIEASTIPPTDDREAAIVRTLNPGNYTAIVRGQGGTTGIAVVEAYDLSQGVPARLANISSRGLVETADNVMIGGVIVGGSDPGATRVVVRAIGPSLATAGVQGALLDPTLQLVNANGATLGQNDDWKLGQHVELETIGIQPSHDAESAIVAAITSGNYTAIVRGKDGTTGVAVVEVYRLP